MKLVVYHQVVGVEHPLSELYFERSVSAFQFSGGLVDLIKSKGVVEVDSHPAVAILVAVVVAASSVIDPKRRAELGLHVFEGLFDKIDCVFLFQLHKGYLLNKNPKRTSLEPITSFFISFT